MIYNTTEMCLHAEVDYNTLKVHEDRGAIPVPSVRRGRRNFYSQSEKDVIVSYFKAREKGSRIPYRGDDV